MKKFDTESSDFSTGLFSLQELTKSYYLYNDLRKSINNDSKLKYLLRFLQEKENVFYEEYYRNFKSFVYEQLYDTNLYEKNFDIENIAEHYTEYSKFKSSNLAYNFLRLQDGPYNFLETEGFDTINQLINKNNRGIVLAFYHWGLFQLIPILILYLFKKPVALFAHKEAILYQREIIERYYPSLLNNFIGLPTSIPSLKKAIKLAENGCVVCILPELNGLNSAKTNKHSEHQFLGNSVIRPRGPAAISSYANVPLIRTIIEDDFDNDKLFLKFKLLNESVGKNNKDIELATDFIWKDLESLCLEKPHLWGGWEIFNRIKGEDNWLTNQQKR